jgi:membrane-bound lytic murein transglycosylase F
MMYALRTSVSMITLLLSAALAGCDVPYVEQGDLPSLRERGTIRIIVPRRSSRSGLPRTGHPLDFDRELAADFVRSLDLRPRFIWVSQHEDLIPALLEGRGDLIAASLTVTADREGRVAFSAPTRQVQEVVVTRLTDTTLLDRDDLAGRTIWVRRSSSYWETAQTLQESYPTLTVVPASERLDTPEILYRVAEGEIDLSIADDNILDETLAYLPAIRGAFAVGEERANAWAVRPAAARLADAVNAFLRSAKVDARRPRRYTGDLPELRDRNTIRVITTNTAATYFIWRGQLLGFEYDLARRFADRLGLQLEIVVPPSQATLLSWLRQGYGDVVAAGLTPTRERELLGVRFSRPYHQVVETVVARIGDDPLESIEDLAGRTIVVRRRSSYWNTAEALRSRGIRLRLEPAPESLATEEIIRRVADGDYDLTIADSHILEIELAWRSDIRNALEIGEPITHAWAVRDGDTLLVAAIDHFFREDYRGLWFNLTHDKYFDAPQRMREQATERVAITGEISPYDSLIRTYADSAGFDWLLIASQMYQESRFDPTARSFAGAVGLMQTMPRTAAAYGVADPIDPEGGIRAGVHYLEHQYSLFEEIPEPERIWFALASYNAGYGHVQDARRLARQLGRDPDVWFDEVERVMPLLARTEYYERAPHGYCRCREPVRYVSAVRERYEAYTTVLDEAGLPRIRRP